MRGAEALIRTLVASGVDTCFMNPGTSEMHFVASLDAVLEMRGVLCLFEGVATGAADGYARMAGTPLVPQARRETACPAQVISSQGGGLGIQEHAQLRRCGRPQVGTLLQDHLT
ncbi:MAG: thiamine pyrophosphate-binding protein, partial [Ilumatobacteraceae bacterium]